MPFGENDLMIDHTLKSLFCVGVLCTSQGDGKLDLEIRKRKVGRK